MTDLHPTDRNPNTAKDPDFTIPEDRDRIAEIQESIDELGRALKEAFGAFADGCKAMALALDGLRGFEVAMSNVSAGVLGDTVLPTAEDKAIANVTPLSDYDVMRIRNALGHGDDVAKFIDAAVSNGVDPLAVARKGATAEDIAEASDATTSAVWHARHGNIRLASQAMALAIKSKLPRTRVVATKPINGGDRLDVVRVTGPGGQTSAVVSIYTSGKATTGGKDDALRADLRALLEAEGFDVRC